jgi:drug/metabolite transporter (DMT)-like permease
MENAPRFGHYGTPMIAPPSISPLPTRSLGSARVAAAMLALCCIFWGLSFPVMKLGSDALRRAAFGDGTPDLGAHIGMVATFNAWRFGAAAALYWLLTHRRQRGFSSADRRGGIAVGVCFGAGMCLQLLGVQFTPPSVSAFLTALAIIFAPLAQWLIFRRPVGMRIWLAVGVALVGIAILSMPNPQAVGQRAPPLQPPIPWLGEGLTVLAAIAFTAQIMTLDRFGQVADTARLTWLMLLSTALFNGALGLLLSGGHIYTAAVMGALIVDATFLISMLVLVVFCSIVAMHLMTAFQPRISPAAASVIYCLEPFFAAVFSVLFRTEDLTLITIVGGTMVLAATVLVALKRPTSRGPASLARRNEQNRGRAGAGGGPDARSPVA